MVFGSVMWKEASDSVQVAHGEEVAAPLQGRKGIRTSKASQQELMNKAVRLQRSIEGLRAPNDALQV